MNRPVDFVVTGFVRNPTLCAMSFDTPRRLKQQGVVRAIRYVTWDSPELDAHVAPVAAMPEVEITRVPQPAATGNGKQKGVVWQVGNLDAALKQVQGDDTLVVKTRPDFIFDVDFLADKIRDFDRLCAIDAGATAFGTKLRHAPFSHKIWIPWADANQPFFYEDAAFAGLKRDLKHLVTPDIAKKLPAMADLDCGSFAHVVRFGSVFLGRFPIFKRYFENYHVYPNDMDYRRGLLTTFISDPYFWHLVVAHAWILHSAFHIDAGYAGDLMFFPNNINQESDWTDLAKLRSAPPYNSVAVWRENTCAGKDVSSAVLRVFGRLVDDEWPRSLFTQSFTDIPPDNLQAIVHGIANYGTGCLREMEDSYYARLNAWHRDHWKPKQAA